MPPILPDLTTLSDLTSAQALASIDEATEWFRQENTIKIVKSGLFRTARFLLANNQRMNSAGNIEKRERWFNNSRYEKTDSWLLREARKSGLRRLTYGHGVMHLLSQLNEDDVISSSTSMHWDRATNLAEYQATEVLLGKSLRKLDPGARESYLNLDQLLPFFGYVPDGNSDPVRNRWVVPMVHLGLWSACQVKNEYQVRIGPLGSLFFHYVFEPIVKAYDAVIESDEPSLAGPNVKLPNINMGD
ncbi:hypothetical protein [Bosea sp. RAC05]|uniref:hypothetical protein n=1 Tax=Bosea sp. RAC05 TaxID=1842539 RepID=UPI0008554896|nr:hypothetical protein [Bosea sp. RAC05]AOG02957.1 hypothetical protein BSY19_5211 [Bosea sp. RAC05]